MSIDFNRRHFLAAGLASAAAAIITPDRALAGAAPKGWTLGVADIDADVPLETLRLVQGRAPQALSGTLYRNGPAKFRRAGGNSGHWFDGDGLIRRFHLADGKATLNARFADTPKRRLETRLDAIVIPGFGTKMGPGAQLSGPDDANAANTSVMLAGGELLALWEGGSPTKLDPITLETRGFKTFRADLKQMPFLAHPRIEPNGTVWNLGGGGSSAAVWKLCPDGSLSKFEMLKLPRASYFHDFTATARHLVIALQPWVQDGFALPLSTAMQWRPELGTQILVIEKDNLTKRRVFELPAFSFFHLGDAWEEADGTIRFDGAFDADPTFGQTSASALLRGEYVPSPRPMLTQVALRPDGRADLQAARIVAEFPTSDTRRAGLPRNITTHVTNYGAGSPFPHAIAQWDWRSGRDTVYDFGSDQLVEEFVTVATGSSETAGWLIGTTLNLKARATELHVIDAANIGSGPVATWRASLPLPLTFHGRFVPR